MHALTPVSLTPLRLTSTVLTVWEKIPLLVSAKDPHWNLHGFPRLCAFPHKHFSVIACCFY